MYSLCKRHVNYFLTHAEKISPARSGGDLSLTKPRPPNPKSIRVHNLAIQIKQTPLLILHMPQSTHRIHRLQHTRMAPNLHLRPRPIQTIRRRIPLRKAIRLRMIFRIRPQLILPSSRLCFRDNAADDHTAGVVDDISQTGGELAAIGFDG